MLIRILILLLFCVMTQVQAQYRGSGRSWPGSRVADSLDIVKSDLRHTRGLSLDLGYYYKRNVNPVTETSDKAAAWSSGTDDTVHYLTDKSAVHFEGTGTVVRSLNKAMDLGHWPDGDSVIPSETYILMSVYMDSTADVVWWDSLSTSGFAPQFIDGVADPYVIYSRSVIGKYGWTHFKTLMSAYTGYATSDWSNVTSLRLNIYSRTDTTTRITLDHVALVRKDAGASKPNPFQTETTKGTWRNDWEMTNDVWLVEESGKLGVMCIQASLSAYLTCCRSWDNFKASGSTHTGNIGSGSIVGILPRAGIYGFAYTGETLYLKDSTGTNHHVSFPGVGSNMLVYWRYEREGTWHMLSASLDGLNWVHVSTSCKAPPQKPLLSVQADAQRIYSMGLSTVEHAAHAAVADRVSDLFMRNDSVFYDRSDSLIYLNSAVVGK